MHVFGGILDIYVKYLNLEIFTYDFNLGENATDQNSKVTAVKLITSILN